MSKSLHFEGGGGNANSEKVYILDFFFFGTLPLMNDKAVYRAAPATPGLLTRGEIEEKWEEGGGAMIAGTLVK